MNQEKPTSTRIGTDCLLGIDDVAEITGFCPVTASQLIKESGRAIILHRRVLIFESSLIAFLKEQEATVC